MTDGARTRSACVIAGASPEQVAALVENDDVTVRGNALGTLVTGRPGGLAIDAAAALPGPVYDILYNPGTGWLAVTIYRGDAPPVRWDNRPGTDAGYPRVDDVLGATTAPAILAALDVPPDAIGHASA